MSEHGDRTQPPRTAAIDKQMFNHSTTLINVVKWLAIRLSIMQFDSAPGSIPALVLWSDIIMCG